jgi:hypothetical protein
LYSLAWVRAPCGGAPLAGKCCSSSSTASVHGLLCSSLSSQKTAGPVSAPRAPQGPEQALPAACGSRTLDQRSIAVREILEASYQAFSRRVGSRFLRSVLVAPRPRRPALRALQSFDAYKVRDVLHHCRPPPLGVPPSLPLPLRVTSTLSPPFWVQIAQCIRHGRRSPLASLSPAAAAQSP